MKHLNHALLEGSPVLCVSNLFPSADKARAEIRPFPKLSGRSKNLTSQDIILVGLVSMIGVHDTLICRCVLQIIVHYLTFLFQVKKQYPIIVNFRNFQINTTYPPAICLSFYIMHRFQYSKNIFKQLYFPPVFSFIIELFCFHILSFKRSESLERSKHKK